MTNSKNDGGNNPIQYYLTIGVGVIIVGLRFLSETWSTLDILKIVLGVGMIGFGIYKLVQKK